MQEFYVSNNEAGQTFLKYIKKKFKNVPDSFFYKSFRNKKIKLNGKKINGKEIICENDIVSLYFTDDKICELKQGCSEHKTISYLEQYKYINNQYKIDVIYKNNHVILMNKPAGLLTQKATPKDDSLNDWLLGYYESLNPHVYETSSFRPSVLNRLDRNTSGLVLGSLSELGAIRMSQAIKDRTIQKIYHTLVLGKGPGNGICKNYLIKDRLTNLISVSADANHGDYTETRYKTLKVFKHHSLVECLLITGKTHQIRAHMAFLGYPVIGDNKYGDKSLNRSIAGNGFIPLMLHSRKVIFPDLGEEFSDINQKSFEAPYPDYFLKFL